MQLLIVDDVASSRETLAGFCEITWDAQITQAASSRDAMAILKERPQAFDCIIYDQKVEYPATPSILNYWVEGKASTPMVLMAADVPPSLKTNANLSILQKPFQLHELKAVISGGLKDPIPPRAEPGEFWRIRTKTLPLLGNLHGDVFLRISDEKFIKLRNSGDLVTEEEAEKYARKNIPYLYLRKSDLEAVLRAFGDKWASLAFSSRLNFGHGWKIHNTSYEIIREVMDAFGFTPETQTLTRASVSLILKTLDEKPELESILNKMKIQPDTFLRDHSIALTFFTCLLVSLTGWDSENTRFKLGLAAFLHDITLSDEDARAFEYQPRGQIPPGSYLNHPADAAALARSMKDLPLDVDIIISQHHERPDGSGFPLGLNAKRITPLSCVLIVAEDLLLHLMRSGPEKNPKDLIQAFLAERSSFYGDGYFEKILRSMRSSLLR